MSKEKKIEKQFMKFYGYEDGRNIKKRDMVELFSLMDKVDPAVAVKIIEQTPELVKSIAAIAEKYCAVAVEMVKGDDESCVAILENIQCVSGEIRKMLENGVESEDERREYVHILQELSRLQLDAQRNSQKFKLEALKEIGKVVVALAALPLFALGVSGKIKLPAGSKSA